MRTQIRGMGRKCGVGLQTSDLGKNR
jgi:hypothetical protein